MPPAARVWWKLVVADLAAVVVLTLVTIALGVPIIAPAGGFVVGVVSYRRWAPKPKPPELSIWERRPQG